MQGCCVVFTARWPTFWWSFGERAPSKMQSLLEQWNLHLHRCRASSSALSSLVVLEDVEENEMSQSREARPCSAAMVVF